jgi:hypothetical protein
MFPHILKMRPPCQKIAVDIPFEMVYNYKRYVPVAQLDRVSDYESEGRGFESLRARQTSILSRFFRLSTTGFSINLALLHLLM